MSEETHYLDFERPIVDLEKKIDEMQQQAQIGEPDLGNELQSLEEK